MSRDEEKGVELLHTKQDQAATYPAHTHPGKSNGTSKILRSIDAFLRFFTFLATVAAMVVLLKSIQKITVVVQEPGIPVPVRVTGYAKWRYADPFKYFLAANAAIAGYSLVLTLLTFLNKHGSIFLVLLDFIASSILFSAASSATTLAYLGYHGNDALEWDAICSEGRFRKFCFKIAGALLCSYLGWLALAISTILAANRLRHRYHA